MTQKPGRPPITRDRIHDILAQASEPIKLDRLAILVYGETSDPQQAWHRKNAVSATISKMRQMGYVIVNPELPREGYHGRRNLGYTLISAPQKEEAA